MPQGANEMGFGDNGIEGNADSRNLCYDPTQGPSSSSNMYIFTMTQIRLRMRKKGLLPSSVDSFNKQMQQQGNVDAKIPIDDDKITFRMSFYDKKADKGMRKMQAINKGLCDFGSKISVLPIFYVDQHGQLGTYICTSAINGIGWHASKGEQQEEFSELCRQYNRAQYLAIAHMAKRIWISRQQKKEKLQFEGVTILLTLLGNGVYVNPDGIYGHTIGEMLQILDGTGVTIFVNSMKPAFQKDLTSSGILYENAQQSFK
jgi:hypothetical protein